MTETGYSFQFPVSTRKFNKSRKLETYSYRRMNFKSLDRIAGLNLDSRSRALKRNQTAAIRTSSGKVMFYSREETFETQIDNARMYSDSVG